MPRELPPIVGAEAPVNLPGAAFLLASALLVLALLIAAHAGNPASGGTTGLMLDTSFRPQPNFATRRASADGPDLQSLFTQAGLLTRKVLEGAKIADLPVERPTRFKLVTNLKTARIIGVTMPTSILLLADEVIE